MATTSEERKSMKEAVKVERSHTTHDVGRLADGTFVTVEIVVAPDEQIRQTTDHDEIDGFIRLSFSGTLRTPRAREPHAAGQIRHEILGLLDDDARSAWSTSDILSLWAIWKRWHLNDLRAACAHMRRPVASEAWPVCDDGTGYRYGHGWLVDVVPPKVVAEVLRLQALPDGTRL